MLLLSLDWLLWRNGFSHLIKGSFSWWKCRWVRGVGFGIFIKFSIKTIIWKGNRIRQKISLKILLMLFHHLLLLEQKNVENFHKINSLLFLWAHKGILQRTMKNSLNEIITFSGFFFFSTFCLIILDIPWRFKWFFVCRTLLLLLMELQNGIDSGISRGHLINLKEIQWFFSKNSNELFPSAKLLENPQKFHLKNQLLFYGHKANSDNLKHALLWISSNSNKRFLSYYHPIETFSKKFVRQ